MAHLRNLKSVRRLLLVVLVVGLSALAASLAFAQGPQPPPREPDLPAVGSNYIPIQGYLTDASGVPLNGTHSLVMRLYESSSGGAALCEDTRSIEVEDGLFSKYMRADSCPIDGRALYLSLEVDGDGEMSPRQYVDNVPYAWSLKPGAVIRADLPGAQVLTVRNDGSGTGLLAESASGAALRVGGSGVIQSTAETYVWISGNGVRPFHQADSTIINLDTIGGALISRGADAGNKNVMLPITIPGMLYGQPARITALDIYWLGDTDLDGISAILLRRQEGVCVGCYVSLLFDHTDRTCEDSLNPTGCVTHFDLSTDNLLSADSGILYLTIELAFSSPSSQIEIGGARLTLEFDE